MDSALLLPPADTPMTGIDFTRRLPCGDTEKARMVNESSISITFPTVHVLYIFGSLFRLLGHEGFLCLERLHYRVGGI